MNAQVEDLNTTVTSGATLHSSPAAAVKKPRKPRPSKADAKKQQSNTNILVLDRKPALARVQEIVPVVEPHPDHLLEMRTINGITFKGIIESLKNVLIEANLLFTERGLRMIMLDGKLQMCASFLCMDAKYFEMFSCQGEQIVGVDMTQLYKIIKPLRMNDILSFIIHKDQRNVFRIIMENPEKGTKTEHRVTMKHLPDEQYDLKEKFEFEFDLPPPEIDSTLLQNICRNLHSFEVDNVHITYTGDELLFKGAGMFTDSIYTIKVGPAMGEDNTNAADKSYEVSGTFSLDFLHNFTKAAHHLSQKVRVALKHNEYLLIEYVMSGQNNSLRYLLMHNHDATPQESSEFPEASYE